MLSAKRAAAPVKVHYNGYTSDADEWIGTDRWCARLKHNNLYNMHSPVSIRAFLIS